MERATLLLDASELPRVEPVTFNTGSPSGPGRPTLRVDSQGLYRDGVPWVPVMGEMHYSRVDPDEWQRRLHLIKAGGIDLVASYVFWIHHEEAQGTPDFTGRLDLRRFVRTAGEAGLSVMVRVGPWCHGEVRNGGLPDWLLKSGTDVRTDDPRYLALVRRWYGAIAAQLRGLLWKDGGPVVGVQIENEYFGPGSHLATLKRLAIEAGLDVPLYTRTGWPKPASPVPFGELLPLYGAYAEGFWARELEPMPGAHWRAFTFESVRVDMEVGADQLGRRRAEDEDDTAKYPYLTCEVGGGMEQSYHRRILLDPRDTLAVVTTRLGSGSNLPGYYMYAGGTNPPGTLSTLQESQATNYWNDVPVLSYDFQAPLGQWGQVREPYRLLRRLHLMVRDFADVLLHAATAFGPIPAGKDDTTTLRCALRAGPRGGLLFVSNYQRLLPMPPKLARLELQLADGETVTLDELHVPADTSFILPVGLELAAGVRVRSATAQPLCTLKSTSGTRFVFFAIDGLPVQFDLDLTDRCTLTGSTRDIEPSHDPAFCVRCPSGERVEVILLSATDALHATKICTPSRVGPTERLVITEGIVREDGPGVWVVEHDTACTISTIPQAPGFPLRLPAPPPLPTPKVASVRNAGPARQIRLGSQGVAEAPGDDAFDAAAVWSITLPPGLPENSLLRVRFTGDVARVYHNGTLLNDHFWHGREFDTRIPPGATTLELRILPLDLAAPIHLHPDLRARLGHTGTALSLDSVTLVAPTITRITLPA